jgi:hypothetical protein
MAPSLREKKDAAPLRQSTLSHFRTGGLTGTRISKSNKPTAPGHDRVPTDVLLAIKPIHLANIANQKKNHEYRTYRLRDEVVRLWLYETSEGGQGRASITFVPPSPPTRDLITMCFACC